MDSSLRLSEDDILRDLRAVLDVPEVYHGGDAFTISELAEELGLCHDAMRERVTAAVARGAMEQVKVRRRDSMGRAQLRDAYRIIKRGDE